MKTENGFIAIAAIIVGLLIIGGGSYLYVETNSVKESDVLVDMPDNDMEKVTVKESIIDKSAQTKRVDSEIIEKKVAVEVIKTGIIKSFFKENNKNHIEIDYIELNSNFKPGGNSGPSYVNNNPKLRTFEVSDSVKILLQETFKDTDQLHLSVDIDSFPEYFIGYRKNNPWTIKLLDGVVVEIEEYFIS